MISGVRCEVRLYPASTQDELERSYRLGREFFEQNFGQSGTTFQQRSLASAIIAQEQAKLTPVDLTPYVQSVTVSNSLTGFGTFAITFDAIRAADGGNLAERIRPRSAIAISLFRSDKTASPVPVMLGIVDSPQYSEDYSQKDPVRGVAVSGRTIGALLADHTHYLHPLITRITDAGSPVFAPPLDFRELYEPRLTEKMIRDEAELQTLGWLALDPAILKRQTNRHPMALARTLFAFYVHGSEGKGPFIKYNITARANDSAKLFTRPLSDMLRLQAQESDYFDPRLAYITSPLLPSHGLPQANCWSIMRQILDENFTELFCETYGTSLDDIVVTVIARKPPWRGAIRKAGNVAKVDAGPRPPRTGESLFDIEYGSWRLEENVTVVTASDVVARSNIHRAADLSKIITAYDVKPVQVEAGSNALYDNMYNALIRPIYEESVNSPSFVQKWGIRVMSVRTRVVPVTVIGKEDERGENDRIIGQCHAYQALLREWYHRMPEFWEGSIVLRGNPNIKVGTVLVDADCYGRNTGVMREYYVRAYQHHYRVGERDPIFTTTVQVERGNDILATGPILHRREPI